MLIPNPKISIFWSVILKWFTVNSDLNISDPDPLACDPDPKNVIADLEYVITIFHLSFPIGSITLFVLFFDPSSHSCVIASYLSIHFFPYSTLIFCSFISLYKSYIITVFVEVRPSKLSVSFRIWRFGGRQQTQVYDTLCRRIDWRPTKCYNQG